mgnify:CR=1 FL=1
MAPKSMIAGMTAKTLIDQRLDSFKKNAGTILSPKLRGLRDRSHRWNGRAPKVNR